jgi:hypothetical protein
VPRCRLSFRAPQRKTARRLTRYLRLNIHTPGAPGRGFVLPGSWGFSFCGCPGSRVCATRVLGFLLLWVPRVAGLCYPGLGFLLLWVPRVAGLCYPGLGVSPSAGAAAPGCGLCYPGLGVSPSVGAGAPGRGFVLPGSWGFSFCGCPGSRVLCYPGLGVSPSVGAPLSFCEGGLFALRL